MIEQSAPPKKQRSPLVIIGAIFAGLCACGIISITALGAIGSRLPTPLPITPEPIELTLTASGAESNTFQTEFASNLTKYAVTYAAIDTQVVSTDTPVGPTDTPLPTDTPTPLPQPIILKGSGDSVVDLAKWDGAAIVKITHTGGSNFAIWSDNANGEHIDLMVNTVGNYQGTLPLDFLGESTTRFEVTAGGAWEIQVLPVAMVRRENIPGTFQGKGDDVVAFEGGAPDLLKANASNASENFAIFTYGDNGRDLAINEIAPYTGTVVIDRQTFVIVITATGPWSIEITAK